MKNWLLENSRFAAVFAASSSADAIKQFHAVFGGGFSDAPSFVETDAPASDLSDIEIYRIRSVDPEAVPVLEDEGFYAGGFIPPGNTPPGDVPLSVIDAAALAADTVGSPGPDNTTVAVVDPAHDLGPHN